MKSVYSDTLEPLDESQGRQDSSWRQVSNLNRMSAQVAKEAVLMYVLWPRDITLVDVRSPECIPSFKVSTAAAFSVFLIVAICLSA